ncbi:hypothetical protein PHYPO_G00026940 [Pangasianodon hypophthalmus]|uniref:Uncharacterized protein n=1 Tax=Pangasianodon hypophthalmus TaxID=310915 RepID=A0A5N5MWN1_PANHP|nr:hypothetical protein PHYPO_G00026940 [Pangasianodon hypophthalmus]
MKENEKDTADKLEQVFRQLVHSSIHPHKCAVVTFFGRRSPPSLPPPPFPLLPITQKERPRSRREGEGR